MRRRRPLAALSLCALLAVGAGSVASFAADTGTTAAAPVVAGGARVIPLASDVLLPSGVRTLPHGGAADASGRLAGWAHPSLRVSGGMPGRVEAAADLFLVDARAAPDPARASLHVTNLAATAAALRGFLLPVGIWAERADGGWERSGADDRFLAADAGPLELELPRGRIYAVSLEAGGSWVGGDAGAAGPEFYLALR